MASYSQKKAISFPVLVHSSPLSDDKGKSIGTMAFVTDMTEHKKALTLAGEVQKSLLPRNQPRIEGFDIAGKNRSCDEIGGDYYDFIMQAHTKGRVNVVVGDITGHGVDAALFMTTARGFLRMRAEQPGDAAQIITDMNRHLSNDVLESGRFMTLFYVTLDSDSQVLSWVRAGHDPALVYDPDKDRFETLMGSGTALGIDENFSYNDHSYDQFSPGKIIVLGTDGIWESQNSDNELFGKERLKSVIRDYSVQPAGNIVEAVFKRVDEFTSGQKQNDDLTLVVIKRV
jgi:sigma-B regulation protein RsbU (phosphoserine phosphatase)